MLYQKLLMGDKPYFLHISHADAFEAHRHSEMELSFCLQGTYDLVCENQRYSLTAGDFALILPLAAHEIPAHNPPSCQCVTIELGYSLLGNYLTAFTRERGGCLCFKNSELTDNELYRRIVETMQETVSLYQSSIAFDELLIRGNLYKISGMLLKLSQSMHAIDVQSKRAEDIKKIDRALEIIYNRYFEPLTVEAVSALCGYSKSNFCKIFKEITGNTFHATLNSHRVEIACILLQGTDDSIEKIALEIGFPDVKSFCRVFKKAKGVSAGTFRKTQAALT